MSKGLLIGASTNPGRTVSLLSQQHWAWALAHAFEKHGAISGERIYIATTVAEQGFWGASVSVGADEENLTAAYGQFQREVQQVQPAYPPEIVNTDGWQAAMNAWRTLYKKLV